MYLCYLQLQWVQTPASSRTWIRMGQASPAFPPLILVDHIEHIWFNALVRWHVCLKARKLWYHGENEYILHIKIELNLRNTFLFLSLWIFKWGFNTGPDCESHLLPNQMVDSSLWIISSALLPSQMLIHLSSQPPREKERGWFFPQHQESANYPAPAHFRATRCCERADGASNRKSSWSAVIPDPVHFQRTRMNTNNHSLCCTGLS